MYSKRPQGRHYVCLKRRNHLSKTVSLLLVFLLTASLFPAVSLYAGEPTEQVPRVAENAPVEDIKAFSELSENALPPDVSRDNATAASVGAEKPTVGEPGFKGGGEASGEGTDPAGQELQNAQNEKARQVLGTTEKDEANSKSGKSDPSSSGTGDNAKPEEKSDLVFVAYNGNGGVSKTVDLNGYKTGDRVEVKFTPVPEYVDKVEVGLTPLGGGETTESAINAGTGAVGAEKDFIASDDLQQSKTTSFAFAGWSTDPGANTPTYKKGGKESFTVGEDVESDVTLYAVWEEVVEVVALEEGLIQPFAEPLPGDPEWDNAIENFESGWLIPTESDALTWEGTSNNDKTELSYVYMQISDDGKSAILHFLVRSEQKRLTGITYAGIQGDPVGQYGNDNDNNGQAKFAVYKVVVPIESIQNGLLHIRVSAGDGGQGISGTFTITNLGFEVRHFVYDENIEAARLYRTTPGVGIEGQEVEARPITIFGYVHDPLAPGTIDSGLIVEGEKLVLKLYYKIAPKRWSIIGVSGSVAYDGLEHTLLGVHGGPLYSVVFPASGEEGSYWFGDTSGTPISLDDCLSGLLNPSGTDAGQYFQSIILNDGVRVWYSGPESENRTEDVTDILGPPAIVDGILTVTPHTMIVTITAGSNTKIYGDPDPTFTATADGVLDGDIIDYTITRVPGENTGDYPINIVLGDNPNYTVTVIPGNLLITSRAVTVIADNRSKVEGAADPTLTSTVIGLVTNDTLDYSLTRAAGEVAGDYGINIVLGNNPNYTVEYIPAVFTITAAPVPPEAPTPPLPPEPPLPPAPSVPQVPAVIISTLPADPVVEIPPTETAPVPTPPTVTPPDDSGSVIADPESPLDRGEEPLIIEYWALLNLILAIIGALAALVILLTYFVGRKDEKNGNGRSEYANNGNNGVTRDRRDRHSVKKKRLWPRIAAVVPGVVGLIFFFITEDMSLEMVIVDDMTLWQVIIFVLLVLCVGLGTIKKTVENTLRNYDNPEK